MKQITITVEDDWIDAAEELNRSFDIPLPDFIRHAASYWLADFMHDLIVRTMKTDTGGNESKKHVQLVLVDQYANMEIAIEKGLVERRDKAT